MCCDDRERDRRKSKSEAIILERERWREISNGWLFAPTLCILMMRDERSKCNTIRYMMLKLRCACLLANR